MKLDTIKGTILDCWPHFGIGTCIIALMVTVSGLMASTYKPHRKEFPRYVINAMSILMDDDHKPGSSYTITSTNVEIIINWK